MVLACVLGSILYRLAVALALNADVLGLEASDLNLVTAVLVGLRPDPAGGARNPAAGAAGRPRAGMIEVAGPRGHVRPRHGARDPGAARASTSRIPQGQFVTVIGSNGAGKSTLLNALTGDCAAERGRIEIDGSDVTGWRAPAARRADRAGVPGPAGRQLRGADDRGEPGAGRRRAAAAAALGWPLHRSLREQLRASASPASASGWRGAWPTGWGCSPAASARR